MLSTVRLPRSTVTLVGYKYFTLLFRELQHDIRSLTPSQLLSEAVTSFFSRFGYTSNLFFDLSFDAVRHYFSTTTVYLCSSSIKPYSAVSTFFNATLGSISLSCAEVSLSDLDLIELSNISSIHSSKLNEAFMSLATSIPTCPSLKSISFICDFDHVTHFSDICNALKSPYHTATELRVLCYDRRSFDVVTPLIGVLNSPSNISRLSFIFCSLSKSSLNLLCNSFPDVSKLRELDFSFISIEDSSSFATLLTNNSTLVSITLPTFSDGGDDLLAGLGSNKSLRSIKFHQSTLSVRPLARSLSKNSTLKSLILQDSNLTPSFAPLFTSLKKNTTLLELEVSVGSVQMKYNDAKAVGMMFKNNCTLTKVDICDSVFSKSMITLLLTGLSVNSTVKKVSIHNALSLESLIQMYSTLATSSICTKRLDAFPHLVDPSKGIFSFMGNGTVVDRENDCYMDTVHTKVNNQKIDELITLMTDYHIKELTLYGLMFDKASALTLSNFLKTTTQLESFSFQSFTVCAHNIPSFLIGEDFLNTEIVIIIDSLQFNTSIKRCAFMGSEVCSSVVDSICNVIKSNTSLTSLDFRFFSCETDDVLRILAAMSFNEGIDTVYLSYLFKDSTCLD
ncbi:hypothetical protein GEMRC1_002198 [Eukaryota sp. GEM-RC1]